MEGIVCKEDCKEATGICANASPGQVWLINGRDYLVVGKFENLLLDGMSPIAFRLLDETTFSLTSFLESNLREVKIQESLTDQAFAERMAQIDDFLQKHRAWVDRVMELSKNNAGTFM